jgi:hypothetical protein
MLLLKKILTRQSHEARRHSTRTNQRRSTQG